MLLRTKKSLNNWVKITDEVEFLVDYLDNDQEQKKSELELEMQSYVLKSIEEKDPVIQVQLKVLAEKSYIKLIRHQLKCSIKNWRTKIGEVYEEILFDTDKNKIKCKIVNGVLDEDLFSSLFYDNSFSALCWSKISPELEFTESDKKK